jgi:4-amino-4-deoxy-L-arabinose transferase-like glycosyltransferase
MVDDTNLPKAHQPWTHRVIAALASYGPYAALVLTLALVTAIHAPTLHDAFHGDDFVAFTDFKTKGFWEYSRAVFLFEDTNFYWRPLGDIFHYSLYSLFGFDTFAFRVAALAIFLATLVCIFAFCCGERLGAWTGVLAALIFGVMPSHVVSVTWVTNTSRLTAALFLMLCLLALQRTRGSRRAVLWEIAAFLCFVVAILSDEVTAALIAVPLLYATTLARQELKLRSAIARAMVYGLVVAVIVPLQFNNTIDNEERLMDYGFGPHMPE